MTHIALEGIDGSGKSTQVGIQLKRLSDIHRNKKVQEYKYSAKNNFIGSIIRRAYRQDTRNLLAFITNRRFVQEALYALNARHNLKKVKRSLTSIAMEHFKSQSEKG